MKKVFLALTISAAIISVSSCGNDKPKTDLNEQEQATVDSTINSDQAQMDSLENAIKAQIGDDSVSAESHEGHIHEGHSH